MDQEASTEKSLMAGDDEEFIGGIMRIMIIWTIIVVAVGIALVLFQDSFNIMAAFGGIV